MIQARSRFTEARPVMEETEDYMTRAIERQTIKLPSDLFLLAAGTSLVGSVMLQVIGRKHESLFVGLWAPTFLILGLYNKIVKIAELGQEMESESD